MVLLLYCRPYWACPSPRLQCRRPRPARHRTRLEIDPAGVAGPSHARSCCANPILLVDEVEKAGGSARDGAIRSTLLALLEPSTAKTWFDECLLGNCNLSAVNWFLTANTLDGLESPFLSRVGIVRVERPIPDMFDALLAGLLRDIATALGVTPADLPPLDAAVIKALRHDFTKAGDLRRIRRAVESALGVAARDAPPRPLH